MKTRFLALVAFMSAATASASAAPRMEGTTSPFTYEAVGATPTLSLGAVRHALGIDGNAARQASKATADTSSRAVPVGAFTYATLRTTPNGKADRPHATGEHRSRESARESQ